MAQWIPGGTWNSKVHQEAQAKRSVPSVHQIKELRTRLINSRQMWRNHSVPIGTNSTTVLKSLRVYWSTRKQRQRYTVRPPSGSLRSSRFLSFFRPRGDRTSERKAGERSSTPGVSERLEKERKRLLRKLPLRTNNAIETKILMFKPCSALVQILTLLLLYLNSQVCGPIMSERLSSVFFSA